MFVTLKTNVFSCLLKCNQQFAFVNKRTICRFKLLMIIIFTVTCFFIITSVIETAGLIGKEHFLRKINLHCDTKDIGETELLQLQQYLTVKRSSIILGCNKSIPPTLFSFIVHNVTNYCHNVHFIISETAPNNNRSSVGGGSSFLITATSEHFLVTCSISDLFNGQYIVNCPMYDFCVKISVEVLYTNFGAFCDRNYVPSVTFWKQTICHHSNLSTDKTRDHLPSKNYVGWYRQNASNIWSWIKITDTIRIVSTNKLKRCLHKLTFPVYFFGDSHARYIFFYLLQLQNALPPKLKNVKLRAKLDVKNFHYDFAASLTLFDNPLFPPFFPRAKNFLNYLSHLSASGQLIGNKTTRHVFVFSAGTWDAARDSIEYLQDHFVPNLTDYIIELHRLAESLSSKVIYLTSPASNRGIARNKIDGRNIAKLAAFNRLVTNSLRYNGVTIVDYFAMTVSRYRESNSDGFHYSTSPNSVGENVAKEVLYEICQML